MSKATTEKVYGRGPLRDSAGAAEFLTELGIRTSRRTLEEDRASGRNRFPYYRIGSGPKARVFYADRDLLEVIESGRVEPASAQG